MGMWKATLTILVVRGLLGDDVTNLFSDLAPYDSLPDTAEPGLVRICADDSYRLLPLFGEQFAKQFMSESSKLESDLWGVSYTYRPDYRPSSVIVYQTVGWLDHIMFTIALWGIITAIVGVIRVGGPSWLKAVIERARENFVAPEVAACGIVLQFGVLLFTGLAVYYPGWGSKFLKNRRLTKGYSYPLIAVGTIVLVIG